MAKRKVSRVGYLLERIDAKINKLLHYIANNLFKVFGVGLGVYLFFHFFVDVERTLNGGNRVYFAPVKGKYGINDNPFHIRKLPVPNMEGNSSLGFTCGGWDTLTVYPKDSIYPEIYEWIARCKYSEGGTPAVDNYETTVKLFGKPIFSYWTEELICKGDKHSKYFRHITPEHNPFTDEYIKPDPDDYWYYKKRGATFNPKRCQLELAHKYSFIKFGY